MAEVLLGKVINEEISSKLLSKWILKAIPENQADFEEIFACNIGQIDFITYFLNFVHEEIPFQNKLSETPQKLNIPKRIDQEKINHAKESSKIFKTNLFTSQPPAVLDHNSSFDLSLDKSPGKVSTPNITKRTPGNKNDSYFSPISPLYQNPNQNNFGFKETKQTNGTRKSTDKYSLCLGDFLVTNLKSSSKKRKQNIEQESSKKEASRRIKPTSICPKQPNNEFQKTENSFNFEENVSEVPVETAVEQRNILVEERNKILSHRDSIEHSGYPALLKRHNSLSKSDIKPMFSMVTYKSNINHVVDIYKTILDHKLVLNITSEIYFLISLSLTRQGGSHQSATIAACTEDERVENLGVDFLDTSSSTLNSTRSSTEVANVSLSNLEIFQTVHNVVYFAVKCLESQLKIIHFYDKTTIKLLAKNERIKDFSPAFSKNLLVLAEKKLEKLCIEIDTPISQSNVCFNIDTDNKDNFTDILGFQAFRKQRDLFYEILRIWETNHLATDWNFALGLGGKIRSLFNFNASPTNYMHLARLFKNQLLSSCAKGSKEKGLSEDKLTFLPSLRIDAEKLNRLTNRLVTKQASNGINSLPVFSGYQEFFKDFIVVASSYFFNRHLCDILISEIMELNDTKFSGMELEEEGNEVDQNTRKLYVRCVKNLRILAKFLGFTESLPYQSDVASKSKNVLEVEMKVREQSLSSLDVKSLLESALKKHTVVFIITWLTKYLAMLDYVSLRLPYYTSVHAILFDLYQNYDTSNKSDNAAIVKFCLGWLFELPHFPDVEYFNFCSKVLDKSQSQLCHYGLNGTKINLKNKYLDYTNIVNQSVLYLCCPYLEEIKKILSTNAPGSKGAVKYITPVTAVESNSEMNRKKLEQQLEEAFFSSQPTSLRKTVEFVSERVASTAVKFICHDLVPTAKEVAIRDLKEHLLKNDDGEGYADDIQRKAALKKQATVLAQTHLTTFLQTCDKELREISHKKIPQSIDCLLPVDSLEGTKNACVQIADKIYTDRVKQWINSHVNLLVFTKDFDSEIQKKVANGKRGDKEKIACILPSGGRNCPHNQNTLSGFHVLSNVREACCKATENVGISSDYVINVLNETYKSLTERNDVNDMITATILVTVFDFCLLLVSGYPLLFSEPNCNLTSYFLKIWCHQSKSNLFKALFCPRNIKILQHTTQAQEAWDLYARIVSDLVDNKLIEEEDLESQCTGFYNRDWSEEILEKFSNFLRTLVRYSNNCSSTDNKFAYLLEFLSDFCSDL